MLSKNVKMQNAPNWLKTKACAGLILVSGLGIRREGSFGAAAGSTFGLEIVAGMWERRR